MHNLFLVLCFFPFSYYKCFFEHLYMSIHRHMYKNFYRVPTYVGLEFLVTKYKHV